MLPRRLTTSKASTPLKGGKGMGIPEFDFFSTGLE
jgi:hypothetical protein